MKPTSPARAAILAALPAPGLQPQTRSEARLAEQLLLLAEERVDRDEAVDSAAKRLWEAWLDV